MLFTEPAFAVFFAIVFTVYWCIPGHAPRKAFLLAASLFFYGCWDWRFLFLMATPILIDYVAARMMEPEHPPLGRKFWLVTSLGLNLALLGFFKYFNFFVDSGTGLLSLFGIDLGERSLNIILPVGISFYTFQTMSYTIDVYLRRIPATRSFLNFALFVSFFTHLVAGPIVRAANFLPQLEHQPRLADIRFRPLLLLFLLGFIKKALVSDSLAPVVDEVYADPVLYAGSAHWTAAICYTVQIYCDFSGYTDMAIALAGMLGYQLAPNFNFPYFARNVTDFWRRWHMSLSSWLREYLYIPLGGNHGSLFFTYRNLMITMLLGGLWHGAAWTFVAWGAIHGAALIAHREFNRHAESLPLALGRAVAIIGPIMTLYYVVITWVFFRAAGFGDAWTVLGSICFLNPGNGKTVDPRFALAVIPLWLVHYASYKGWIKRALAPLPDPAFAMVYALCWVTVILFLPLEYKPFIYFQF